MTTAFIEANQDRIIVTAQSAEDVREATLGLFMRCGEAFCDFTTPVQQADGAFVATGHVRLNNLQLSNHAYPVDAYKR